MTSCLLACFTDSISSPVSNFATAAHFAFFIRGSSQGSRLRSWETAAALLIPRAPTFVPGIHVPFHTPTIFCMARQPVRKASVTRASDSSSLSSKTDSSGIPSPLGIVSLFHLQLSLLEVGDFFVQGTFDGLFSHVDGTACLGLFFISYSFREHRCSAVSNRSGLKTLTCESLVPSRDPSSLPCPQLPGRTWLSHVVHVLSMASSGEVAVLMGVIEFLTPTRLQSHNCVARMEKCLQCHVMKASSSVTDRGKNKNST